MFKLIALNYTVMLNGHSQWLNIKGNFFYRDILISVMLENSQKYIKAESTEGESISQLGVSMLNENLFERIS